MKYILLLIILTSCKSKELIIFENIGSPNKDIYVTSKYHQDSVDFEFHNNSDSNIYLFSTYFTQRSSRNKYFVRYQENRDVIVYSFLPFYNSLSTHLSDRVIISDGYIFKKGQTQWSFIEIKAHDKLEVKLNVEQICSNLTSGMGYYDTSLAVVSQESLKPVIISDSTFLFQFAYYLDVREIESLGSEYHKAKEYKSSIDDFFILESQFICN